MNKIQKLGLVLATVALVSASQVYGMAENWSAQSSRFLTLAGGTTGIAQGSRLEIGILGTNTVLGLQAKQDNAVALEAAFQEWATGTVGANTGLDGTYSIATAGPAGAGFFSLQIYILAFNAPTAAGATQVGLFTSPNWVFPASDGAAANSIDLDTPGGIQAIIGALSSGTVVTPTDLAGTDAAQLHLIVPEPSSIALVGFGLLGLVGLARRRS